eukprot:6190953-Pleurochrysis_carterae.AAC.3
MDAVERPFRTPCCFYGRNILPAQAFIYGVPCENSCSSELCGPSPRSAHGCFVRWSRFWSGSACAGVRATDSTLLPAAHEAAARPV